MSIVLDPIRREGTAVLEELRIKDEKWRKEILDNPNFKSLKRIAWKEWAVADPTTLILIDEADRFLMNSLEQMRSIFDEGTAGMVLIGMPGIEKRVARFPQFYSRLGFVHEFRPLDSTQVQDLLEKRWTPDGVVFPNEPLNPEVMASLIRMRGEFQTIDSTPHADRARSQCQ